MREIASIRKRSFIKVTCYTSPRTKAKSIRIVIICWKIKERKWIRKVESEQTLKGNWSENYLVLKIASFVWRRKQSLSFMIENIGS